MPKEINANRDFRQKLLEQAATDPGLQSYLIEVCKAELLFFVDAFVWTFQPRDRSRPIVRPMITWDAQADWMQEIWDAVWQEDHSRKNLKKSREQGGTWGVLCIGDHLCRFYERETVLLASSDQKLVDSAGHEDEGSSDTLFHKLDFLQEYLPTWLQVLRLDASRKKNHVSYVSKSVINGIPTTMNLGRGGRRTLGLLDESAAMKKQGEIDKAVGDAWHVRVKVSTPKGPTTQFKKDEENGVRTIYLHWRDNPQHNKGLYRPRADGSIDFIDKEYWTEERRKAYDFEKYITKWPTQNLLFPERSPHYDHERETRSSSDCAENLDIVDSGSKTLFFLQGAPMQEDYERVKSFCRPPLETGLLEYDRDTGEPSAFQPSTHWPGVVFRLWIKTGGQRPPSNKRYGMGVDISQGTGNSNSTISIGDLDLRTKVAELTTSTMPPEKFSVLCVAVGRWFNSAVMNWGKQGPGRNHSKRVYELGYRSVYSKNQNPWGEKWTTDPGISEDPDSKLNMITSYRSALYSSAFENPSEFSMAEAAMYCFNEKGYPEHPGEASPDDPSGARFNHGDLVCSDYMLNVLFGPENLQADEQDEDFQSSHEPNPNSLAGRMRQRALEAEAADRY